MVLSSLTCLVQPANMAMTTVVEVFIHYYQALVSTFPMKQEEFVVKL